MKIEMIACVNAVDMPAEVEEYCVEEEINTHYQDDIAVIENDDNPFANWLRENGYEFKEKSDYIGVIAT